jgi:hypothetical protein
MLVAELKLFRTVIISYLMEQTSPISCVCVFHSNPGSFSLISIIILLSRINLSLPVYQDERKIKPENITEKYIFE